MIIGVPKEIKNNENRVALTPSGVTTFVKNNHSVFVQSGAGLGSNFSDEEYVAAGAKIVSRDEVWSSQMVMKVKEPIEEEFKYFYDGLILFTYLHLAAEPKLTAALIDKNVTSIAYETVQLPNRSLPLLTPMSEVAGKMAVQIGAQFLEKTHGGKGVLLGGVPGVSKGEVTIIGGGIAGMNAAKVAIGMGANVTVLDVNADRLRELENIFGRDIQTLMSNDSNLFDAVRKADLVIGAVLIPGAKAPKLVTEEMIKAMQPGSVVIDIAIDQGGIFETSDKITTHDNPVYVKHDVIHYAVANMPGAVPRTSTMALTNNTVPYALSIANNGLVQAITRNEALKLGVNTYKGQIVYEAVAISQNKAYTPLDKLLS